MKRTLFAFASFSLLVACNIDKRKSTPFREIDFFFFNNSPEAFSLKLIGQDSIFLKQFVSSGSKKGLKDDIIYFGRLNGKLKQQIDSLANTIDLGKLDSIYETDQIDGDEYKLYFESDKVAKQISVHSRTPPTELEILKTLFIKVKFDVSFIPVDTIINFRVSPPKL